MAPPRFTWQQPSVWPPDPQHHGGIAPMGRPGAARPGCSRLDAGKLRGLLPIAAVAQGNDPAIAHREHAVGAVTPTPGDVGVHPWRPHAHHHQLTATSYLLQLGPQTMPGPAPQHLLQLVPAVANLRGGLV